MRLQNFSALTNTTQYVDVLLGQLKDKFTCDDWNKLTTYITLYWKPLIIHTNDLLGFTYTPVQYFMTLIVLICYILRQLVLVCVQGRRLYIL